MNEDKIITIIISLVFGIAFALIFIAGSITHCGNILVDFPR